MINLQKISKLIVPPVLLDFFLRIWRLRSGLGFYTFEGNYKTLESVPCGTEKYNDEELCDIIVESRADAFSKFPKITQISDNTGFTILPLLVSQRKNKPLEILDFGGGAFIGYADILRFARNMTDISYTVVETPAMVKSVKKILLPLLRKKLVNADLLQIVENIPDKIDNNSIIFVGGTIQYIDDYKETLKNLISLNAPIIVIGQTPFTDSPTYARMQLNMPHKKLATWVFNTDKFIDFMSSNGYLMDFVVGHNLPLTYKGAPGPSMMASMVFQKIDNTDS